VLWHLLYESSARAEEVLMLDVGDLDTVNRCAVVTRKGGARLSYRRAAELFEAHTAHFDDGPYTLHQLRHSRLTHAAEDGASTPVLSGHTSVRSLAKYARVSDEGLRRFQAEVDPAARRRPNR
jgi:integrase/recombinase XerC/integrase/recombinase XerD